MSGSSYWLAFGDIHDDNSRFSRIPELDGAAGVIITGDITLYGGARQAERALEGIAARVPVVLAQIGNMDRDEVTAWLEKKGWNLHARAKELFPGVMALGVGCSPPTPFNTPSEHPEARLDEWMEQARAEALTLHEATAGAQGPGRGAPVLVLVSHTPPYATACDRLHSGAPAGSHAVRAFIEKHQPALCLCGHIHESRGEDHIGATHVINPGTLGDGGYSIIRQTETTGRPGVRGELRTLP